MAITVTIDSVAGNPNVPASIMPPPPWEVVGTVDVGGGPALDAMAYQIDDGQVNALAIADPPSPYRFNLNNNDLPASGIYLLTVIAWDVGDPANGIPPTSATATVQIILSEQVIDPTGGLLE